MAKSRFDLESWMVNTPLRVGTICKTCQCAPEMLSYIDEFRELRKAEYAGFPLSRFHAKLRELGYPYSYSALRHHLIHCSPNGQKACS